MREVLTRHQADAFARFLLTLRPDWSLHYTRDAVWAMQAISDDPERIWRVAIRGALDPVIRKPDVLAMNGAHWKAQTDVTPEPPRPGGRRRCCGTFHGPPPDDNPTALCPHVATDYAARAAEAKAEVRRMLRYQPEEAT